MMNSGKLALVTGGNRGMGLETCHQLIAMGWQVLWASRSMEAGIEAIQSLDSDLAGDLGRGAAKWWLLS